MKLYAFVAGLTPELARRLKRVAAQCPTSAHFEIVDVLQNAEFAAAKGVQFTPLFLIENGHDDLRILASEDDLDRLLQELIRRDEEIAAAEVRAIGQQLSASRSEDGKIGLAIIDGKGNLVEADAGARKILKLGDDIEGLKAGVPVFRADETLRLCVVRDGLAPFWIRVRCLSAQKSGITVLVVFPDEEASGLATPITTMDSELNPRGITDWSESRRYFDAAAMADAKLDLAVVVLPDLDTASRTFGRSYVRKIEESFIQAIVACMPERARVYRLSIGVYVGVSDHMHDLEKACQRIDAMRLYLGGASVGESSLAITIKPKIRRVSDALMPKQHVRASVELIADELARERVFQVEGSMDLNDANIKAYATAMVEADLSKEFFIVVQPVIRLSDESIVGGEVLLRWNSPAVGQVSPATFIPIAEQVGLIDRLSFFVLDQAIELLKMMKPNEKRYSLAINLSPNSLKDPVFREQIINRLKENPELCPMLAMEITERYRISMTEELRQFIDALRQLEVEFFIDDFGSGNASLNLLKDAQISTLKLAGELADELREGSGNQRLLTWLEQVVMVAHGMGARVLAEGIETEDQIRDIKRIGVDEVQGFYYARPMPISEFLQKISL